MATLEEILARGAAAGDSDALAALQSNNIGYELSGIGSSIAELVGKTALQDALANKPVDLKGAAIASALGGLIGGISKGYGNRVLTQEYDDYKNAVTELTAGRPVDESKIGSTVFNLAKNKADIFRAARAADIEKRRNAILDAGLQAGTVERAKATAFDPTLSLVANMDPEQLASLRQKLGPEGAAIIDENLAKLNTLSPVAQEGRKIQGESFSQEAKLRNDFRVLADGYLNREEGYRAMLEAFKDTAGTSDYELIRRGAQAIEPGLAVRADDEKGIKESASAFGQYSAAVENFLRGKSKLDPKVREGIVRMAARSLKEAGTNYDIVRDRFRADAARYNFNPDSAVPWGPSYDPLEMAKSRGVNESIFQNPPAEGTPGAGGIGTLNGKKWVLGSDGLMHEQE